MGANAETRIYTNRRKPMAGDAKGRLDSTGREEETLQTQTIRANAISRPTRSDRREGRTPTLYFARKGIAVECIQTDNDFEFTDRFSNSQRDLETLFEATAKQLGIRHKLIRPYIPRHNGKVECSHREDQKRFYDTHRFYSLADFGGKLPAHQSRSNSRPMRPLLWAAPRDVLSLPSLSNMFVKPTFKG